MYWGAHVKFAEGLAGTRPWSFPNPVPWEHRLGKSAECRFLAHVDCSRTADDTLVIHRPDNSGEYQSEFSKSRLVEKSGAGQVSVRIYADFTMWTHSESLQAHYASPVSLAKTKIPFAGITIVADAGRVCIGPPFAQIAPPFPATHGFTQLS